MVQQRVLVTGSNGSLGRVAVTAAKEAGHWVRGLDRATASGDGVYDRSASEARWHAEPDDFLLGAITDRALLDEAMAGVDVVIHLAATPDDLAPFDAPDGIMENNIEAVYLVCQAALAAGVQRLMLTSSVQAIQGLDLDRPITLADGTAPTNHYSLTKVFSEDIGQMYARGVAPRFAAAGEASPHRMSVVITRIGWFVRNTKESEDLVASGRFGYYLSRDDAGRYFVRVIESEAPHAGESAVLFAMSKAPAGETTSFLRHLYQNCNLPRQARDKHRERWRKKKNVSAGEEMFDLSPALDVLGWEPEDVYPAGVRMRPPCVCLIECLRCCCCCVLRIVDQQYCTIITKRTI
jgi:nucleoside-diphosphate-sugar epimerase